LQFLTSHAVVRSVSESDAICAHLACSSVYAIFILLAVLDTLIAAEAVIAFAHGPSQSNESFAGVSGNAGLEAQNAAGREIRWVFSHGLGRAFVMPARAVACGLHIEPVVHTIDDDLRLALRLHVTVHMAAARERHQGMEGG
jgi:hypothetical protein